MYLHRSQEERARGAWWSLRDGSMPEAALGTEACTKRSIVKWRRNNTAHSRDEIEEIGSDLYIETESDSEDTYMLMRRRIPTCALYIKTESDPEDQV
jgi:hypothetical protein